MQIDFYFDLMCPFAYQTSLWMREVRDQAEVDVTWRFFSLEEINREEGKKHPWEREWSFGWSQMRIAALIKREQGNGALDRWYEGMGKAFHEDARPTHDPDVHREVLTELDFDPGLVERAIADPTTTDDVRSDHDRVVGTYAGWGVPILVFPSDRALFGPVIIPAPTGDEALRLWDVVLAWQEFPHLWEMQQPKRAEDLELIADVFSPYLEARSWRTIANPTP